MKVTNDIGAPDVILQAVRRGIHPINPSRYGVTSLIGPPQIRQLKIRHDNDIELPLSSFNWLLMGTALHHVFESGETNDVLVEEYLRCPIPGFNNVQISGMADLIENIGDGKYRITDHKTTSVYGRLSGSIPREEWIQQLNVYAYIYSRALSCSISEISVFCFYRDWKVTHAATRANYPPSMEVIKIPLWSEEKQYDFIKSRLEVHAMAENLPDASLPPCSIDDRWGDEAKYAVTKKGNKRAKRVVDSKEEAEKIAEKLNEDGKAKYEVLLREGELWRRCKLNGCSVAPFCQQFARSKSGT